MLQGGRDRELADDDRIAVNADVMLSVTGLTKRFGEHLAVDDVTFEVPAGGSLAIVGESGSGKTTVARMIVGLEWATSGSVLFEGEPRSGSARSSQDRRRRARQIQMVLQDPYSSLDPRQSIVDCLDEAVALFEGGTVETRRPRVDDLAGLVGLDGRQVRAYPGALSGGQRQRVAIARALAAQPRLLILDESVAALDVSIQAQVLNLLADIRDQTGISYLLISHDLAVVRQITEDVIVMRKGRVVESGRTAEVLDQPTHPYTRLLRDSVPRPGWKPRHRATTESESHNYSSPGPV
jgi:ABC-type glutathione transport system ATPase component